MELVEVRGACRCPGQQHEEDIAYLMPELGLEGGLAAMSILRRAQEMTSEQIEVELGVIYVKHGLDHWNWTNGTGEPIVINDANLRRNVPWSRMFPLADRAAGLYGESVFAPLVETASRSSPPGPTTASTSPRKRSSSSRRKR